MMATTVAARRAEGPPRVAGLRWAIYVRQSKKRQRGGQASSESFELQERACRETIARTDSCPTSVTVFADIGRSGKAGISRPQRDELLRQVQAGSIDAVIAFKVSRLGRDLEESAALWRTCATAGAFVATVDVQDLSNPLVRSVYFGMAEAENLERSHFSQAVMRNRRERQLPVAVGVAAYGLEWTDGRLHRHPAEWPWVERMFEWYLEGDTICSIARRLSAAGVLRRNAGHSQWDASAVSQKLRSPWYVGQVPDGRAEDGTQLYFDCGERFIDQRDWQLVQARLDQRKRIGRCLNHALSGLLWCGACNGWSPMSLCYSRKPRKDGSVLMRHRYRCIHRVRDPTACGGQSIDALRIEAWALDRVREVAGPGGTGVESARLSADRDDETAQRAEHRMREIEALQDDMLSRRESGEIVPDRIYNQRMAAWETELQALRRKQREADNRRALNQSSLAQLEDLIPHFPDLPDEDWFALAPRQRNDLLRTLFPDGILVSPPNEDDRRGSVERRLAIRPAQPLVRLG